MPLAAITAWSNTFPWADPHFVEQDLILRRVLTELFNDSFLASKLAFRGGTAKRNIEEKLAYSLTGANTMAGIFSINETMNTDVMRFGAECGVERGHRDCPNKLGRREITYTTDTSYIGIFSVGSVGSVCWLSRLHKIACGERG